MTGVETLMIGGTLGGTGMTEVTRVMIVEVLLVSIGAASASWRRQERGDLTARKGRVADGKGGHIGRKMTSGQKGRGTASEMETPRDGTDPDHEAEIADETLREMAREQVRRLPTEKNTATHMTTGAKPPIDHTRRTNYDYHAQHDKMTRTDRRNAQTETDQSANGAAARRS